MIPWRLVDMGNCRFCNQLLDKTFVDLGMSPLSNAYLTSEETGTMEPFYPLHAFVCGNCLLVQLEEFETPENIFSDYAYFSSYSDAWLAHCKDYTDRMIRRFWINEKSHVVEIASNDGYLLQFFQQKGISVLGIEPAENVAKSAKEKGVSTLVRFFGKKAAAEIAMSNGKADLLIGNNVLAHVPDINDFVAGMNGILSKHGIITMEFPHLLNILLKNQFDTIYHEHFSYFSFIVAEKIFAAHGLTLFDVEELPTHGGSLRIYGRHHDNGELPVSERVSVLKEKEIQAGLNDIETYLNFSDNVHRVKNSLLEFLIQSQREGASVAAYGAAAKGNTLLNFCGIRTDYIDYVVDRNPYKQGRYLPGTHIPIYAPEKVEQTRPDYLLILPWNIRDEIIAQMAHIRKWGGKFVVPVPETGVIE